MPSAILLISCQDQRGVTATVTDFVYRHNGNILHAVQHIDDQSNTFFMRIEWSLDEFSLSRNDISPAFEAVANKFQMSWDLYFSDQRPNVAIFVSKHLHCLHDLLYRYEAKELTCNIPLIISNHNDAKKMAKDHKIEFAAIPVTAETKTQQEKKQIELLRSYNIDLIILARYHQILTKDFVDYYPNRIINIHHSFLPAFPGEKPYARAHEKGVKIIGATSHYVTEQLDEGPIIEQDTVRVSHRDTVQEYKRRGNNLERIVLSRAVRWHLERRILCFNNKTVVFE